MAVDVVLPCLDEAAALPGVLGALPEGAGALDAPDFRARAGSWLAAELGGSWDAVAARAGFG